MRNEVIIKNISSAVSAFANSIEHIMKIPDKSQNVEYPDFANEFLHYFPLDKINQAAGTYDQYLLDLQKTIIDNYQTGNYQVSYFYAHLIFMSYTYYSVELAYSVWPEKVKDQYDLLNAYATRDKPSLQNHSNTYVFSKIPEKEIFKVFYAIGMDVQYIQQLSEYVGKRDNYAHATGEGNINAETLEQNVQTIKRSMEKIHDLFLPYLKESYVHFLLDTFTLPYDDAQDKIADYILEKNFSLRDIEFMCNFGISNVRRENGSFLRNYRHIKKIHCAFIEYCIENEGVEPPTSYKSLRDDAYLLYRYKNKAADYVENELGVSAYRCGKEGGEFPVYECPDCGEEQLAYDADSHKYHCFACDSNFNDNELSFCSDCGSIMRSSEIELCPNCIDRKMEE